MKKAQFRNSKRITRLVPRSDGGYDPVIVYQGSSAEGAASSCPLEAVLTSTAQSTAVTAKEYLRLQRKSKRGTGAGWFLTLSWNVWKAVAKGTRYTERGNG